MTQTSKWRLDAATGIGFVVLLSVALLLPGSPPKAEDTIERITAVLIEERQAFLVSGYLAGLAAMAYLWFLGSVGRFLGTDGEGALGGAATAGGTFAISVVLLGMMMFNGVAFVAAGLGDPAVVRALTDVGNGVIELGKFGFAVFILAVSRRGAAAGVLPVWLVRLGLAAVPLMLLSAVALFIDHGMFQFGGAIDLAGALPALAWTLALSIVMMRTPPPVRREVRP